ncbi:hypothetical protein GCM10009809_01710 [Isoptericola hypogeus]|uniref:Uncharacterized protein n=1 Tax=Isoptericola hypogeus TaxID=300179 RepID=A0ABN2IPF1_9MICO
MLQRILGGVLVLLGLVAVALGVASATVWRDSDTVVATAEPVGDGTMVVTDPGVLGLVSGDVTVTATAPEGQPVTVVVGRDVDVLGWVGKDPYSRVTGLQDWDTLTVEAGQAAPADGEEEAAPSGANPAGSDMWIAETSEDGTATLRWSDQPGRWTLLAAGVGEDAQAPTLELTWPRAVATPYLWPAVGAGVVLVLVGLALFVVGVRRGRSRKDDGPRGGASLASGPTGTDEPDGATSGSPDDGATPASDGTNPFAPVRAAAPAAAATTTLPPAVSDGAVSDEAVSAGPGDRADGADSSGTAEVPLAGRLLRRSRRRTDAPDAVVADAHADAADAHAADATAAEPAPAGVPASAATPGTPSGTVAPQPALPVPEPRPATGSAPYLSRRELRAQEEARRAAEQGGMTRMLRAITGSIPAVRPQSPADPATPAESAEAHDLSTPAGRAAAWRATWGFGQGATGAAGTATTHDATTTDGENR